MTDLKFDKDSHTYTHGGRVLDHITAIIACLQPTEYFTEEARDRGSRVHQFIQDWWTCEPGVIPSLPPDEQGYGEAWSQFLDDHEITPILVEQPLHHPGGWAGTPDLYGHMDGTLALIEVKTGAKHPSYAVQTAAQEELIRVNGHKKPQLRLALCLQPDGNYKIDVHKGHTDYGVFLSLLNVWRWKRKHNLT